jgi:hypothetical protein
MRAAKKPRLSKDFSEDVVRLHTELSDVRRAAYHAPNVQKHYTDSIVAVHDELAPVKRAANRSVPVAPSKSFSRAIAALTKPVAAVVKTWSRQIADLKQSIAASTTANPTLNTLTVNNTSLHTNRLKVSAGTLSAPTLMVKSALTHTGNTAYLCRVNTGCYIEMAAGGGASLIDMHGGADNADLDFNVRLLCAGNQLQITATSGVLISGNLSVSGPVTDSNGFRFFNRPDIYFQGLIGSRGNGSGFDQTRMRSLLLTRHRFGMN